MRTKKLKEVHDVSVGLGVINDVLIEDILKRLEKENLSYEDRVAEVKMLKTQLEQREILNKGKALYRERKSGNQGYWVGVAGSMLGIVVGEVINKLMKK